MKYTGEILTLLTNGAGVGNDTLVSIGLDYTIPLSGFVTLPQLYFKYNIPFTLADGNEGFRFRLDLSAATGAAVSYRLYHVPTVALVQVGTVVDLDILSGAPVPAGEYLLQIDGWVEPGVQAFNMEFSQENNNPGQVQVLQGAFLHIIPA